MEFSQVLALMQCESFMWGWKATIDLNKAYSDLAKIPHEEHGKKFLPRQIVVEFFLYDSVFKPHVHLISSIDGGTRFMLRLGRESYYSCDAPSTDECAGIWEINRLGGGQYSINNLDYKALTERAYEMIKNQEFTD